MDTRLSLSGGVIRYRRGRILAVLASREDDVDGEGFWLCQAHQHVMAGAMKNGFRAAWMEKIEEKGKQW